MRAAPGQRLPVLQGPYMEARNMRRTPPQPPGSAVSAAAPRFGAAGLIGAAISAARQ